MPEVENESPSWWCKVWWWVFGRSYPPAAPLRQYERVEGTSLMTGAPVIIWKPIDEL